MAVVRVTSAFNEFAIVVSPTMFWSQSNFAPASVALVAKRGFLHGENIFQALWDMSRLDWLCVAPHFIVRWSTVKHTCNARGPIWKRMFCLSIEAVGRLWTDLTNEGSTATKRWTPNFCSYWSNQHRDNPQILKHFLVNKKESSRHQLLILCYLVLVQINLYSLSAPLLYFTPRSKTKNTRKA